MESTLLTLLCWTCVYVESHDSIPAVVQQMRTFDRELNQLKMDIPQIERKLTNNLELSELSLRAELMTRVVSSLIDRRVRAVLADIFKDRSLDDMVSSHVISEISHVKMNNNMLKRQHQHMSREISQLRKDRTLNEMRHAIKVSATNIENLSVITDDLLGGLNDTEDKVKELRKDHSSLKAKHNELESSVGIARMRIETVENNTILLNSDAKALNQEITKVRVNTSNSSKEVQRIVERLNQQNDQLENKTNMLKRNVTALTHIMTKLRMDTSRNSDLIQRTGDRLKQQTDQMQILVKKENETSKQFDLNETRLKRFQNDLKFLKKQHASDYNGSSTPESLSTTPTPGKTVRSTPEALSTTPTPGETVRSRLLISDFNTRSTILHQLKIDGNKISTYPYLKATRIEAITYDPTNNAIVYSRSSPAGIYSTILNSRYTSTLRTNIMSYGLAIDEGRQLLFLTTYSPSKTVSRMRADGKNFITIIGLNKYGNNPVGIALDTRKRMIYTSNHGKLFSLTYEGRSLQILYSGYIRGVALDVERALLYFHGRKKIMRRPLSGGSSVRVGEVDNDPVNMQYYNKTVYISGLGNGNIYALYTYFNNDALMKLTTGKKGSVFCLIP